MSGTDAGFLSKERITAPRNFNRWLIPPAALAVHLSIGQVYALSVFNLPLTRVVGVTEQTPADWRLTSLGWIFSIAVLVLGLAAAFGGHWVERVGPRKAMAVSAVTFGGGFLVSALGVQTHQLWLLYLGYGVLGGIGIGFGYVSPVSTLIKWFPDRRGLATGMAIMGFGGGAMLASPMSVALMDYFSTPDSVGVAGTFVVLGIVYFIAIGFGALIVRVPPEGWKPEGWDGEVAGGSGKASLVTDGHVHINQAMKTPQFYLMWAALFLNVTAGIGVLGQASAMSQEMFPGVITAGAAAGFVGMLSLFNMAGRFFWASLSDRIGRKTTFSTFFILGMVLFALVPQTGHLGAVTLFVIGYMVIISMYGGGFSTIPAYLADVFGTRFVGGIHGRILTAWSAAGVVGPTLVNYIRQYQIDQGVAKADAYTITMYIMAGLLFVGLLCNLKIRQMADHHLMDEEAEPVRPARGGPTVAASAQN
ncbi:putative MFS-type transporter YhjX [wastewater metagenome]|uniref:Putative MFS-type transporter YhjX n=2 Tax=unclassified sequences TaxID=12908 RepID=A0A5B8R666_9ZZZZ|nr:MULTISPECIES: OFA family MFS transporter [Arhodomonas]MCS4504633.1 OFA family MFS transporter [Arhodomonas aquaeolei]QEA04096.1 putative MFS-type transporter YhjX [uncultured organism]